MKIFANWQTALCGDIDIFVEKIVRKYCYLNFATDRNVHLYGKNKMAICHLKYWHLQTFKKWFSNAFSDKVYTKFLTAVDFPVVFRLTIWKGCHNVAVIVALNLLQ